MKKVLLAIYLVTLWTKVQAVESIDAKNVHGLFSRSQVLDLTLFRNKVTGLIFDTNTKASCTGTLIGPRHVITAAHCVYNSTTKEWSDSLTFTPGKLSKDDDGFGVTSFKKFFVQQEYLDTLKEEYDFALIELDSPIGNLIGWAGFRSLKPSEDKISIIFAGYAGDKEFGSLWSVSCPAEVKADLISYACDSFAGMSGSSIFQTDDSQNFVIGVHTWGGPETNGGVSINSKNYELLNAWKNGLRYSSNTVIYSKK